ncbi:hypothetical protein FB45DRAFT_1064143 [Roridomyces roridus]|uniref:Uncharacterized protein n=1 Tax=Roridomyces roridus TaxID=1738132 RepID=A0AAD7FCN6_9AGAR|nr:hypothetical protein FB45DRAFT_1064143 [Roridomyces roridus]
MKLHVKAARRKPHSRSQSRLIRPPLAILASYCTRQVFLDVAGGSKFWEKVDEQLGQLREEPDESRVSKKIARVLKNDCRRMPIAALAYILLICIPFQPVS